MGEIGPEIPEIIINQPEVASQQPILKAVVVCGMGPVALENIKGSERPFPTSPLARRNSQAAKLLASRGLTEKVVVSGYKSKKKKEGEDISGWRDIDKKALDVSEAELHGDTYLRMVPTNITDSGQREAATDKAKIILEKDEEATTTVENIFNGILNPADESHEGLFNGSFAVLSSEFHGPRLQEMLKVFGVQNARVLSAERILEYYGYDKYNPDSVEVVKKEAGKPDTVERQAFKQWENDIYKGQPGGLENLLDNPGYTAYELVKLTSNRRLWEAANSFRTYYQEKNIALPPAFDSLPEQYDPDFDYGKLRERLSVIPNQKHGASGKLTEADYRQQASDLADSTDVFLEQTDPDGCPYKDSTAYAASLKDIKNEPFLSEKIRRLNKYYDKKNLPVPEVFQGVPSEYDPKYDYTALRGKLEAFSTS